MMINAIISIKRYKWDKLSWKSGHELENKYYFIENNSELITIR